MPTRRLGDPLETRRRTHPFVDRLRMTWGARRAQSKARSEVVRIGTQAPSFFVVCDDSPCWPCKAKATGHILLQVRSRPIKGALIVIPHPSPPIHGIRQPRQHTARTLRSTLTQQDHSTHTGSNRLIPYSMSSKNSSQNVSKKSSTASSSGTSSGPSRASNGSTHGTRPVTHEQMVREQELTWRNSTVLNIPDAAQARMPLIGGSDTSAHRLTAPCER